MVNGSFKGGRKLKRIGISMNIESYKNSGDLRKIINTIKRLKKLHGVSHVEFSGFQYGGADGKGLEKYYCLLEEVGKIISFSLHFSQFAALLANDRAKRWKWQSRLRSFLDMSVKYKAQWVVLHMGEIDKNDSDGSYVERFYFLLRDYIERLRRENHSIRLLVENSFQGVLQKGIEYGVNVEQFNEFFGLVYQDSRNLKIPLDIGMVLDLGHANINGEKPDFYCHLFGEEEPVIHFNNNWGRNDRGHIRDPHRSMNHGTVGLLYTADIIRRQFNGVVMIAENNTEEEAVETIKVLDYILKK